MDEIAVIVIWNVAALIALCVSMLALGGALSDWEYLREKRLNGLRAIQSGANLRTQGTRALVALLFLLIGILTLVDAPGRGGVSRWMLVAASLILTVGGVWDWIDRRRSVALIIKQEDRAGERS